MNKNLTFERANMKEGDMIFFNSGATLYTMAREYHWNNSYRITNKVWRLIYPSEVQVIERLNGLIYLNPFYDKEVIELKTGQVYGNFYNYINAKKIEFPETIERTMLQVIDAAEPRFILSKRNRIKSYYYPPHIMFKDTYDKLTEEQRFGLDMIKYVKWTEDGKYKIEIP